MKLFGLELWKPKTKAAALSPVSARGGWFPVVREPFTGAWQRNLEIDRDAVLANAAVFACVARISADIAKLRIKLVRQTEDSRWSEVLTGSPFLQVLKRPSRYSTRIKFVETWLINKLVRGNFYCLKQRDQRGVVVALHPLDSAKVTVLCTPEGDVYYRLGRDNLSGIDGDSITVPAREVIHDPAVCLHHPLIGVSPLYACGVAAMQGSRIQNNSAAFFGNYSSPSGILTAPGSISTETAERLKEIWQTNFTGDNAGKIAVLGDSLKFEPMTVNPVDAQLIEQLKWTVEDIARAFQMPLYKLNAGPQPTHSNIESLELQYYSDTLQSLIEQIEILLDEGLELPAGLGTEFDTAALLRMDTAARFASHSAAVGGGWMSPNEARLQEDLPPVEGGDTPYLQVQNYSLAALAKRDAAEGDPAAVARSFERGKIIRRDFTVTTAGGGQ